MTTVNRWRAAHAAYAVAVLTGLTVMAYAVSGCSDGVGTPSVDGSRAASAASSLAARGGEALASATAAAASELARIKGGVNAKADVRLGAVTEEQGKATVPVTAANNGAKPATYTVQVSFRDSGGNLLDAVVVTVPDVPAHGTARATARSHRDLTGTVKATVEAAVRH
ncbi:hypothetical protein ACFWVC_08860 [Streptomyces sp. NPDC058691]|uniref:hypothetical protein n=1 Tax=Streptomyces sp. NPDC058691 TaxID=3346601 RepID=UPI0036589A3A